MTISLLFTCTHSRLPQLGLSKTEPDTPRTDAPSVISGRDAVKLFEKRAINILHPLNFSNMVTDKLNPRRAKRIVKVFQVGMRTASVMCCGT